jgi:Zn-dependent protease with chaperone function
MTVRGFDPESTSGGRPEGLRYGRLWTRPGRIVLIGLTLALVGPGGGIALAGGNEAPQLGSVLKRAQQVRDIQMTDEEEQKLGAAVSERIRDRYGVVQDPAVHKYVSLVGRVLALKSTRPQLDWQFIVLDTDGVNALAAPGGYVHITRGALSLMKSEAELADVLGHEIIHVTEKHTIEAIQKGKMVQVGADETVGSSAVFSKLVDKAYEVVDAGFGRNEELEADKKGIGLANAVGYDPSKLAVFLTTLTERNKASTEKQGLFASHPEMKERLDKLAKTIKDEKLTAAATVDARFTKHVSYTPVPIAEIATVEAGSAGLAGGSKSSETAKKEDGEAEKPKKRGFGLGRLVAPSSGGEKASTETTGSSAARGVDSERKAKGGSNKNPVPVTLTAADITAFKKEGNLN